MINLFYRSKILSYFATLDIVLTALLTSSVITCTAYVALWIKVRFRDRRGLSREADRRLAKTLCLVTGAFVLTWLPFQSLLYVVHFCLTFPLPTQNAVNFIKVLQYCNSFMNTVIYSLRMPEFRKAISEIFNCRYSSIKDEIPLKNIRGETFNTFSRILGSYSSLNVRHCMGTENVVSSGLNSSSLRRKCLGIRGSRTSSSRRTYVDVSVV